MVNAFFVEIATFSNNRLYYRFIQEVRADIILSFVYITSSFLYLHVGHLVWKNSCHLERVRIIEPPQPKVEW